MGAIVLQPASEIRARKNLMELQKDFKKTKPWRHATDLNHSQKIHFCKAATGLNAEFFGVVSYKPTLKEYSKSIDWEPDLFYNKCSKYILERVGSYLGSVHPELANPTIVFEERNHDYDRMIRYLSKVKENPIYVQSRALSAINPFGIVKKSKSEEELLRYADLIAHSLYCCVNKTPDNFQITEPRYLTELSSRFAADEKGSIIGSGIKPIHHMKDLLLDEDTLKKMLGMRALPRRSFRKLA